MQFLFNLLTMTCLRAYFLSIYILKYLLQFAQKNFLYLFYNKGDHTIHLLIYKPLKTIETVKKTQINTTSYSITEVYKVIIIFAS